MLEIHTEVMSCGKTSVIMKQVFYRDGKLLTEMKVIVVGITPDGKPVLLPPVLREKFTSCH
jgi:acyl-CoA thioesterase FadM